MSSYVSEGGGSTSHNRTSLECGFENPTSRNVECYSNVCLLDVLGKNDPSNKGTLMGLMPLGKIKRNVNISYCLRQKLS
jgi:hypothetical protein